MANVRLATEADEDAIVALWVGLVEYHHTIEKIRPSRWQGPRETWAGNLLERLRSVWAHPESQAIFVATESEEVVGFVRTAVHPEGPLPAHVETLFVSQAHRGTGVGRALVRAAEQWCLEHGADEVGVEFLAPNEAARQTYERLGYQPFLVTYIRRLRE